MAVFSVCVSKSLSTYKVTSHWIRAHPNPVWPILTWLHLRRLYFQIKSHSQLLRSRISTYPLWGGEGHNSTHNRQFMEVMWQPRRVFLSKEQRLFGSLLNPLLAYHCIRGPAVGLLYRPQCPGRGKGNLTKHICSVDCPQPCLSEKTMWFPCDSGKTHPHSR